jgi:hypothetical protein
VGATVFVEAGSAKAPPAENARQAATATNKFERMFSPFKDNAFVILPVTQWKNKTYF